MYLAMPLNVESTVCIMIMLSGLNIPMHAMQHKCILCIVSFLCIVVLDQCFLNFLDIMTLQIK